MNRFIKRLLSKFGLARDTILNFHNLDDWFAILAKLNIPKGKSIDPFCKRIESLAYPMLRELRIVELTLYSRVHLCVTLHTRSFLYPPAHGLVKIDGISDKVIYQFERLCSLFTTIVKGVVPIGSSAYFSHCSVDEVNRSFSPVKRKITLGLLGTSGIPNSSLK